MNLNRAEVIGRVTKDPEARTTPNGQNVTSFSVATNRYWSKDGERKEETQFIDVVTWGKLAETSGQYLIKGQEVYVAGRLQTRSWDGQDGVKRYRTEIIADTVQFGQKPGQGGGQGGKPGEFAQSTASKPAATSAPAPSQTPATPESSKNTSPSSAAAPTGNQVVGNQVKEEEINIEDIPF